MAEPLPQMVSLVPPEVAKLVAERLAAMLAVYAREAWSVQDVHQVTGLGVRTIRRWSETGEFPAPRKRGGKCFWLPAEVRNWLQKSPRVA